MEQLGDRIKELTYTHMRVKPLDCKIAGSYRREKDGSTDIDILMIVRNESKKAGSAGAAAMLGGGGGEAFGMLHGPDGVGRGGEGVGGRGVAAGDTDDGSSQESVGGGRGQRGGGSGSGGHYKLDQLNELIDLLHAQGILTDDLSHPKDSLKGNDRWEMGAGNFYMGIARLGGGTHRRIDLRCFEEHEEAAALLHCTGSGIFNRQVQRVALALNYQLSEKGLCRAMKQHQDNVQKIGDYIPLTSEADIFEHLGLQYVEPRDRNGRGDVISKATGRCWFSKKKKAKRQSRPEDDQSRLALPAPRMEDIS